MLTSNKKARKQSDLMSDISLVTEAQSCHTWLLYHPPSFSSEAEGVFWYCIVAVVCFLEMVLSMCYLEEIQDCSHIISELGVVHCLNV